jgi:hypothetical protein
MKLINKTLNTKNVFTVAVLIATFSLNGCNSNNSGDLGTYDDPKIALIETQKALSVLSKNVNKGYESVQYITECEIAKNKIFKLEN